MQHLLDSLNEPQREAVTTTDGPLLVIAGAGSGKTRVITYRIAWLIREARVAPRHIFAATFTNKAAGEMRDRVLALLGLHGPTPLAINTFHSLCAMILRKHAPSIGISQKFLIADERDSLTCMREALKELGIRKEDIQPSQALWVVGQCKLRLLGPEGVSEVIHTPAEEQYKLAFERYQTKLRGDDAVDFDDLIGYVVQLFEEHPEILAEYHDRYRYLMVDEYQDTNRSQYRLVELLASKARNVCVVGDEDQSIYSWRGADITNLLDFQKQYSDARLIRLEQNYRSTGNILAAAAHVISHNTERLGKTLWCDIGDGPPIGILTASSEMEEGERICRLIERFVRDTGARYRDIALFYRANSISRAYEEAMRAHDIPYQVVGGTGFYDRMEVRDLVSYLQLVSNPNANLALLRIINKPRRGVGEKTLSTLMNDALRQGRSLFEQVKRAVDEDGLKGRAKAALSEFVEQVEAWMKLGAEQGPVAVINRILDDTNYRDSLGDSSSIDVKTRLDNIDELIDGLIRFEETSPDVGLQGWLETIALASAQDEITDEDRVSMMTIHAAKGLEFPLVFVVGMEDSIFPNRRSVDERGDLEEERRLFYVAVTRAQRLLILSRSEMRVLHGELRFNPPSPLLFEVPEEVMAQAESIDLRNIESASREGNRGTRAALEAAGLGGERVRDKDAGGAPTPNRFINKVTETLKKFGPGGTRDEGSTEDFGREAGRAASTASTANEDRHWVPLEEEENDYVVYDNDIDGGAGGRGGRQQRTGNRPLEAPDLFGGGKARARGAGGGFGGRQRDVRRPVGGRNRINPGGGTSPGAGSGASDDGPLAADLFGGGAGSRPTSHPAAGGSRTPRRVGIPSRGGSGARGREGNSGDPLPWAAVGVRVRHEHYGEGTIVGQSGTGRDRRLLVAFDDDDSRQLEILARFANLEHLED